MKTLKKIWRFLSGKKTVIGMIMMLTAQGLQAFFPNALTPDQINFLNTAGAAIGGIGLIHKGAKTETAKRLVHKK
jgi:ABC-type phosphate transport system auxiliary subunit